MNAPYLSVIIPTYNRAEKLEKCLEALKNQSLALGSFEVIIVNDGSTDETSAILKKWVEAWPILRVLSEQNSGQGIARNKALKLAQGQVVLFIGDDIYPQKNFLEEHARFHQNHPEKEYACLGLTEWDPSQEITSYMVWLTEGGPQFAYHDLKPGREASFWYFYTSNISLKREFLEPFDEDFKTYGFEDIELGYRLAKKGMKLIFLPEALTFHEHPMSEQTLRGKMLAIGKSAVLFQKKHPEVAVIPRGLKKVVLYSISRFPIIALLWLLKKIFPFTFERHYWYVLSKRYFFEGVRRV